MVATKTKRGHTKKADPKRVLMIPKKRIVVSCVIPHSNEWINDVMLSPDYRVSQAKKDAHRQNLLSEFEKHLQVIDEFDNLIYFILCNNAPFWQGMVFTSYNGKKRMKLERIEYQKHDPSQTATMRCFLSPFK